MGWPLRETENHLGDGIRVHATVDPRAITRHGEEEVTLASSGMSHRLHGHHLLLDAFPRRAATAIERGIDRSRQADRAGAIQSRA